MIVIGRWHRPDGRLVAVGHLTGGGRRRQQRRPADEREVLGRMTEGHLQLILDDLVVVKLHVGRYEPRLRHAHQQHALIRRLHRDQQPLRRVGEREPLPRAEVQETELGRGRIETLDPLLHAVFVRPDVDRAGHPGPDALLPRHHAPHVLPQVLVLHDAEVRHREVAVGDPADHLILGRRRPGVHERHLAAREFADDQVVNRDGTKVEPVAGRIEAHDVFTRRADREHAARHTIARRGRRRGSRCRCRCRCRRRCRRRCGRGGRGGRWRRRRVVVGDRDHAGSIGERRPAGRGEVHDEALSRLIHPVAPDRDRKHPRGRAGGKGQGARLGHVVAAGERRTVGRGIPDGHIHAHRPGEPHHDRGGLRARVPLHDRDVVDRDRRGRRREHGPRFELFRAECTAGPGGAGRQPAGESAAGLPRPTPEPIPRECVAAVHGETLLDGADPP